VACNFVSRGTPLTVIVSEEFVAERLSPVSGAQTNVNLSCAMAYYQALSVTTRLLLIMAETRWSKWPHGLWRVQWDSEFEPCCWPVFFCHGLISHKVNPDTCSKDSLSEAEQTNVKSVKSEKRSNGQGRKGGPEQINPTSLTVASTFSVYRLITWRPELLLDIIVTEFYELF